MSISVRPTKRKGGGFLIVGCVDSFSTRPVLIFARKRETAEHIRDKVKRGEELTVNDWEGDR